MFIYSWVLQATFSQYVSWKREGVPIVGRYPCLRTIYHVMSCNWQVTCDDRALDNSNSGINMRNQQSLQAGPVHCAWVLPPCIFRQRGLTSLRLLPPAIGSGRRESSASVLTNLPKPRHYHVNSDRRQYRSLNVLFKSQDPNEDALSRDDLDGKGGEPDEFYEASSAVPVDGDGDPPANQNADTSPSTPDTSAPSNQSTDDVVASSTTRTPPEGNDVKADSSGEQESEIDWDKAWEDTRQAMEQKAQQAEQSRKEAAPFSGRKQVIVTKTDDGSYVFTEISADGSSQTTGADGKVKRGSSGGFGFAGEGQGDVRERIRDREQETVGTATTNKVRFFVSMLRWTERVGWKIERNRVSRMGNGLFFGVGGLEAMRFCICEKTCFRLSYGVRSTDADTFS